MKNFKTLSLLLLSLFILNLSCSKDDDPVKEQEEQETGEGIDFTQETINIVLPASSSLDLTNYKVRSVVDDFDINSNGSSTANFLEGNTNIAYVLDENENPILAGFINAEKREISIRTTVEVSLYYNLGTVFLPQEVKEIYINNISTGINIDETVSNTESIFESNSNLISSESFLVEIQALTKKFTENLEDFSEGSKTSSGVKIDNRTLSGIRLIEESGNNILFRNTIRRRAHAFLYKTETKNEQGQRTTLIDNIVAENAVTSKQVSIPPTAAVTSVIGLLQTVVSGKGLEIGAINSEPTVLMIESDNNVEETYQARVVGPGRLTIEGLTDEEAQKLLKLNIETFALDILLPIISTAIAKNNNILLKSSDEEVIGLVDAVTAAIGNINGANDAAKKGEFSILTSSFIEGMSNSARATIFEPVVRAAAKVILSSAVNTSGRTILPAARDKILNNLNKFFKALEIADIVLQGVDIWRVSYAIENSKPVENFKITINRGTVSLEPFRAKAKTGGEDILYTAKVNGQDLEAGQAFEYVWTCTGEEGILVAINKDETHPKTLTTSVNQIKYRAQGSNGSDQINVEVFIKQGVNRTRVDDNLAVVDVVEFEMKITPNNQKISGGVSINLFVVDENGKDFSQNDESEYSFIWKTGGQFGKFNGTRNTVTQDVNKIRYEALERTQEGTENISVSVYRKAKGSSEGYRFLQTVDGTINIDNDPKKKYFVLEPTFYIEKHSDEDCLDRDKDDVLVAVPSVRNLLNVSYFITKIDNAISYSLRMPSLKDGNGDEYGGRTWNPWNNNSTLYPNDGVNLTDQNGNLKTIEGDFELYIYGGAINACNPIYGETVSRLAATQATGYLTITLE